MNGYPGNYFGLRDLDLAEITIWLEEELGPEGDRWVFIRHIDPGMTKPPYLLYIFEDEDVTAFKLMWT